MRLNPGDNGILSMLVICLSFQSRWRVSNDRASWYSIIGTEFEPTFILCSAWVCCACAVMKRAYCEKIFTIATEFVCAPEHEKKNEMCGNFLEMCHLR